MWFKVFLCVTSIVHCSRSSTGEGHFFFTGIHMRRLFNGLKERISKPASSKPIPIPNASQGIAAPPLPPRRDRSKTVKNHKQSSADPIRRASVMRDCETMFVHTPSLSSFTQSPGMLSRSPGMLSRSPGMLSHSPGSTTTVNSTSLSHIEPLSESDLASSTTTMNLASLSNNLPISLDYGSSIDDATSLKFVEDVSDDESDTSEDSIYIQMSSAFKDTMMSGSASQNDIDLDVAENWRHSGQFNECPMHNNPSYLSFETVMNT